MKGAGSAGMKAGGYMLTERCRFNGLNTPEKSVETTPVIAEAGKNTKSVVFGRRNEETDYFSTFCIFVFFEEFSKIGEGFNFTFVNLLE